MEVITTVEGKILPERQEEFINAFEKLLFGPKPEGFVETQLLQNMRENDIWRVETLWQSFAALEFYQASEKPAAVSLFEQFGAVPQTDVFLRTTKT